jgi:hypothetical protein
MPFSRNVFVNCPFDEDYLPLLRPLLFTILRLGLTPRIALEELDSGVPRIQKLIRLITESKYAVHDLSRLQASQTGEYYRLNMPFELGIDVGCRLFGNGRWSEKRCLVLEAERYRYQAAISDISNSDIAVHKNSPEAVVTELRNWLTGQLSRKTPSPSMVWGAFLDFMAWNYDSLKRRGFSEPDIERLPINELLGYMSIWIARQRPRRRWASAVARKKPRGSRE